MSEPSVPSAPDRRRSSTRGTDEAPDPYEHPSGASALRQRLRAEVAASAHAFDAAALRCDRALASGDRAELEAALHEQRAVVADTERRLSRAVARAVAERARRAR